MGVEAIGLDTRPPPKKKLQKLHPMSSEYSMTKYVEIKDENGS